MIENPFSTILGLALSGGGARGVAHIGVLKALRDREQSVDCVAGTSAGALVGALFAFGKEPDEILEIFSKLSLTSVGSLKVWGGGLFDGSNIAKLVEKHLGKVDIADANIPLAIVCCDLVTGKNVVFKEGPLSTLVQASAAFPGIFEPVKYKGMILVDGMLTENVPISAARQLGANFTVAVRLTTIKEGFSKDFGIKDVLDRSFDILVDHNQTIIHEEADYEISLDVSMIDRYKVSDVDYAISHGYEQALKMLNKPLVYWSLKPFLDYTIKLTQEIKIFAVTLIKRPKLLRYPFRKTLALYRKSLRKQRNTDKE